MGFSLNIDYQQLAFKQKYFNPNDSSQYIGADLSRATGGMGFGFTFGVIYKVNDMIQVGGTYISKQSFSDIDYFLSQGDIVFPDGVGNMLVSGNGTYSLSMGFPQQLAFGVAITPNEKLKITVDFKWINFEDTHDELSLNGEFALVSQTTGAMIASTNSMPLPFGWENQTVYAIGIAYMVSPMLTLRAGYNHADSPIDEEDVFNNIIFPAIVEDHIGLGAEFTLGNHWGVGLAYMKAMSNEIKGKGDLQGGNSGATLTMDQSSLLISITYNMGK